MPDRPPHVLYVAWGFPPSRGGGVYRALATVNAFAAEGFDVTVLTAEGETFEKYTGSDASLEARVADGVEVVRVPFDWPAVETDLREWSTLRTWAPRVWRNRRTRLDHVDFPETGYGPWRFPLERAAREIHARRPVDLTVASANPNVDFCAAAVLNAEFGVPFVMDYRDAWMLDVFDGGQVHEDGGRVDRIERSLLAGASEVWFVNEPIRAWHARRHPALASRMHVVANGYDPEFAPQPRTRPSRAPVTFGYIGTASSKVPMAEFAAGWHLARSRGGAMTGATAELWGYLGFYSTPAPALLNLVATHAEDGVTYRGPVPKAQVAATYDRFDVCLLVLGAGRYVTSGKVFEYASAALPIVSIHDPGNAATDVLAGYPLWFGVPDLTPESIAGALTAAAEAALSADEDTRRACAEFARRYERDLQVRPRVQALRRILEACVRDPFAPAPDRGGAAPTARLHTPGTGSGMAATPAAPAVSATSGSTGPGATEADGGGEHVTLSEGTARAGSCGRDNGSPGGIRVVLVDSGRRTAEEITRWRDELRLGPGDDLALLSWAPPREPLAVAEQLVVGPKMDWTQWEPRRPALAGARSRTVPPPVSDLPRNHPRRLSAAAGRRFRRVDAAVVRRLRPAMARLPGGMTSPWDLLSATSPIARVVRRRVGIRTDGIATDFTLSAVRSPQVRELVAWADVVVPVDARSRKAAWALARCVHGSKVVADLAAGRRVVASRRPRTT